MKSRILISKASKEIFDDYWRYLRTNIQPSKSTYYQRLNALRIFLFYIDTNGKMYNKIKYSDILDFLNYLDLSSATVWTYLSSIRHFYDYLKKKGVVGHNPARIILWPQYKRRDPQILFPEEVASLFTYIRENINYDKLPLEESKSYRASWLRDYVILEFLYYSAAKITEVICVKMDDLNLDKWKIVLSRGKKTERTISLEEQVQDSITEYLKQCRPKIIRNDGDDLLFISDKGIRFTSARIRGMLNRYFKAFGLMRVENTEILRDSRIIHLLEQGIDLDTIKEFTGNSNLAHTKLGRLLRMSFINKSITREYSSSHPEAYNDVWNKKLLGFKIYLQDDCGLKENTVSAYVKAFRHFVGYLVDSHSHSFESGRITAVETLSYLDYIRSKKHERKSAQEKLDAFQKYWDLLIKAGDWRGANPFSNAKYTKQESKSELLNVISNAKTTKMSIPEICLAAGVSKLFYYQCVKDPEFQKEVRRLRILEFRRSQVKSF